MGGGPESRCVGRVYGADGAVRVARVVRTSETLETTYQTARCHDPDHVQSFPHCKKWLIFTGMRRITTFRSSTDRIYDSGSIR